MSNNFEDVYLTSDSESDQDEDPLKLDNVNLWESSEVKLSPLKLNNVNLWESSCCITVSPIVSSMTWGIKMEPMTIPTMYALGRTRIQNVFDTFF